jgi:microcystin-dependent protein
MSSILPYILGANILTPPVISSYTPAPGSQSPLLAQVVVTFSEVMDIGSVQNANNWVLTNSLSDNLSRILAISVLNAGTGAPTQVLLTFDVATVAVGQSYTLTALPRIVNLAGLALSGTLAATFTNGATPAAPTILSWSPTSGNLGLMGSVFSAVATFSQAMNAGTVTNLANWAVSCNFGTITLQSVTYDSTLHTATVTVLLSGVSPGFGFAITGGTGILDSWGQSLSGQAGVPYTYLGPALFPPPLSSVLTIGNSAGGNNIDLNLNQALNWRFENVGALPAFGNLGRVVFNTADGRFYGDKGTAWGPIGGVIGTPATVPYYNGSGDLTSSATTDTELGYLHGVTSAIQTQLNGKQATGSYLTALTSDVSASGPGSAAATVNSVGGSSAASINTATVLVNTARSGNVFLASPANGTSAAPAWRAIVSADLPLINLASASAGGVTGTLPIGSGGTGQTGKTAAFNALSPNTTLGDLTYHDGTNSVRLAGNTTATKKFLSQTGTGAVSAAPTWSALAAGDIPALSYVTSVALAAPAAIFSVSGSPVTASGTLTLALATQTANFVWAGPTTGAAASPTFRALVSADLPLINLASTAAGGVTGALPIGNGGTGQTGKTAAFNALSPNTTLGDTTYHDGTNSVSLAGNTTATKKFLTQTGTGAVSAAPSWSTIVAADIPIIDLASTTNGGISGTLPINHGGTGQTTAAAAFDALAPTTTKGDLVVRTSTGNSRLGIGADGTVATADSTQATGISWQVPGASSGNPAGVFIPFAGGTLPAGYLWCDGSAVSRTTYSALFAAIGTAHGTGDGSTTFNVPDLRGRFLRGSDNMTTGAAARDPGRTSRSAAVAGTWTLAGSSTVSASSTVTVTSTANIALGMTVSGTNIPANSIVIAILSSTTIQIGNTSSTAVNATATGSAITLTFSNSATANFVGSVQTDAIQGHDHSTAGDQTPSNDSQLVGSGGVTRNLLTITSTGTQNWTRTGTPTSDGTNGTPRTSTESRPINSNANFIIKY